MPRPPTRVIVFSHANGFPAGTYRLLFEAWRAAGYTVHAIDKYGHDPRYPVTPNWPHLGAQLIDFIEQRALGPAYLVGHSLGGYLSLMAASRRPDLALGLVMLDSPVVAGWKARALQFVKATGIGARFSPGRVSSRRRHLWAGAEEAHAHFAAKPAFSRWDPRCLADYIAAGTQADGTQRRLSFEREIETAIYDTLPHHLARVLRAHPLRCDVGFVRGTESREMRMVGVAGTRRLLAGGRGRIVAIDGSHLFPFERPDETAATVLELVAAMRPPGPAERAASLAAHCL